MIPCKKKQEINNIHQIENAFLLPSRKNDFGGGVNGKVLFGVYDKKKEQYFSHTRDNKLWEDYDARVDYIENNTPKKLKGKWIYGGPLFFHFGHFISESLSRLWSINYLKEQIDGIIFTLPPYMKDVVYPQYMIECFDLLGIDTKFIFSTKEFYIVEMLYVPEQGAILGKGYEPWYKDEISKFNINKLVEKEDSYRKVIFSRKNYKNNGRIMGMDYFNDILKLNDFNIICPEKFSLFDQISYLVNAELIVFEEGSALHLLDLVENIKATTLLIKRRSKKNYLDYLLMNKCSDYNIYSNINESPFLFSGDASHNVCSRFSEPNDFVKFLNENLNIKIIFDEESFGLKEIADIKEYLHYKVSNSHDFFK